MFLVVLCVNVEKIGTFRCSQSFTVYFVEDKNSVVIMHC